MTTQFDPSEFTEEFDLERFRAGELALSTSSNDFISIKDTPLLLSEYAEFEALAKKNWRMRPAQDGWIQHGGGECPIPWAKAGELKVKLRCGEICSSFPAEGHLGYHWPHLNQDGDIIAYRLTDGWIPVKSGECPRLPGSGVWECKFSGGVSVCRSIDKNPDSNGYRWEHLGDAWDIVAVRRVPQVEASVIPNIKSDPELLKQLKDAAAKGSDLASEVIDLQQKQADKIKHQLDGIDADIREIFDISSIIDQAFAEARDGKKVIGPVVECPVLARLMR